MAISASEYRYGVGLRRQLLSGALVEDLGVAVVEAG